MNKPKPIKSRYKTEAGYQKALNAWKKEQTALKKKMLEGNSFQDKEKATKKSAAKKPAAKKPVAKKPATTTRPKRTANQLKIKKAATTAQKAIKKATPVVKKAAKTVAKKAGEAKKTVTKKAGQLKQAIKKGKAPAPKTAAQKAVSKVYKGTKKLVGDSLKKRGQDALKIVGKAIRNPKSAIKGGVGGALVPLAGHVINTRVDREFAKRKGMTLQEFNAAKKKMKDNRNIVRSAKNIVNKVRGKSGESSTTKNIKKQKTSNSNSLKISQRTKDLREAKRRVRKAKGYNKKKLQREVRYLEKFGKQGRTWSNPVGAKGNNKPSSVKTDTTKSAKPGSARAKMRAKNEARFGKAHVDKLRAKNKDFQAMKKKKMTKAEFIRRYPNSQTAKRA